MQRQLLHGMQTVKNIVKDPAPRAYLVMRPQVIPIQCRYGGKAMSLAILDEIIYSKA